MYPFEVFLSLKTNENVSGMKKSILSILYFGFFPLILLAQTGKVYDNLSLPSKILKMDRKYAVYLPPDYETSERSYPVLYLLHGGGDYQTGWVQFGEVLNITDQAIKEGKATPMVIIMPDANTGPQRGFGNDATGTWRYENFFFEELMPFVEKKYRIKAEKRYRAVSGLSMGGYGTFFYALHHPELFSSACPLSPGTGPMTIEDARTQLIRNNPGIQESLIEKYYKRQSVMYMINNMPDSLKRSVRWYIDCGDDDNLSEGSSLVHIAMRKREIPHEFRIRDGAHNWTFWRGSLPEVLWFISQGFHQY
jgi:enterochelin esterase-like enzyme